MSMEAQFYEARRRQSAIERRQSLRIDKKQSEYEILYIPVRVLRQSEDRCTCTRIELVRDHQSLYQRDRDIYPRPRPLTKNIRRAKLPKRFTSINYLQQW